MLCGNATAGHKRIESREEAEQRRVGSLAPSLIHTFLPSATYPLPLNSRHQEYFQLLPAGFPEVLDSHQEATYI